MPHSAKPRHLQVREQLRRRIENGEYAAGSRLPPETELFKQLGASSTTVVHALNDLVREGLIVRRRGSGTFVAERKHPPLIPGRVLKLGVLWFHPVHPRLWHGFCHRLTLGALEAWGVEDVEPALDADREDTYTRAIWRQPARGLTVDCLGRTRSRSNRAPALPLVRQAKYDGILTLGILEEPWLEELLALNIPTVVVDFPTQRFASRADLIYADPQGGFRGAVDHFVAQGLRRIFFVGARVWNPQAKIANSHRRANDPVGTRIDPDSFLRCSAWRQALDAHGIEAQESWVHYERGDREELAARWAALPEQERPQAVLCHGVKQAEALIQCCAAHGLQVEAAGVTPEPHIGPALNIHLDAHEMGAVAGELLLARLRRPARPFLSVGVRMTFQPQPPIAAPATDRDARPSLKYPGLGADAEE